ncbi:MAG: hypothetical protein LBT12_07310 [Oscillospiraceae bacterium]|jgi:hypothetical protein|nr:hypothetical protein [Oscillospiraceae bacterium]
MRGHHTYTRSWFAHGGRTKNAGTFTVELTAGVFDAPDDAIGKINPKCASVPEKLAPLGAEHSLLRIYHPYADATVVTRSWTVSDKITGRGVVPYSFSLLFGGKDNDMFLRAPAKAFDPRSFEPYQEYAARAGASPDAQPALSVRFDPNPDDYKQPVAVPRRVWENAGFNEEVFVTLFVSLCAAMSPAPNSNTRAKVALKMLDGANSEALVLMMLSVFPHWFKRKFAASAAWTGAMDGAASTAIDGMHLICYIGEEPYSEVKFPTVDLTNGTARNLDDAVFTETATAYARWMWANIDNADERGEFETFLYKTFPAVPDRMPFYVVANSHYLWRLFEAKAFDLNFDTSLAALDAVAAAFSKSVGRYAFVGDSLTQCLTFLSERERAASGQWQGADYTPEQVRVLCTLALSDAAGAAELAALLYGRFFQSKQFDNLDVLLHYNASRLNGDAPAEVKRDARDRLMQAAAEASGAAAHCRETAREGLMKFAQSLRTVILTQHDPAFTDAFGEYKTITALLRKEDKLPQEFFTLPPGGKDVIFSGFINMELYDLDTLGRAPKPEFWNFVDALRDPEERFSAQDSKIGKRRSTLFKAYWLYYDGDRTRYAFALEKLKPTFIGELLNVDDDKVRNGLTIRDELTGIFFDGFENEWAHVDDFERRLDADETWSFVKAWLNRFETAGFQLGSDGILGMARNVIRLTPERMTELAGALSPASFEVILRLWGDSEDFSRSLDIIDAVDNAGDFIAARRFWERNADAGLCVTRMFFRYKRRDDPPLEWAVAIIAAEVNYKGQFSVKDFVKLRGAESAELNESLVADLFGAIRVAYSKSYPKYDEIARALYEEIRDTAATNPNRAGIFKNYAVRSAFDELKNNPSTPQGLASRIGGKIAGELDGVDSDGELRNFYSRQSAGRAGNVSGAAPALFDFLVALIAAASPILLLLFGAPAITAVTGGFGVIALGAAAVLTFFGLVLNLLTAWKG